MEWKFLLVVMRCFGFSETFKLIAECLGSNSLSFLLDGSPLQKFLLERGLHQDDRLSPNLYILKVEVLSRMILRVEEEWQFSVINIGRSAPSISRLMFVDDTMLFYGATPSEFCNLKALPWQIFFPGLVSQSVNMHKSGLIFLPNCSSTSELIQVLGMKEVKRDKILGKLSSTQS